MARQLGFEDLPAASHHDDPDSSTEAERILNSTGRRDSNLRRVTAALRDHSGMTSVELVPFAQLDKYEIRRRLHELDVLRVARTGPTVIRNGHTRQQTWWWNG